MEGMRHEYIAQFVASFLNPQDVALETAVILPIVLVTVMELIDCFLE